VTSDWQRGSTCGDNACIEVAPHSDGYGARLIRSSRRPHDQIIIDPDEWPAFKAAVAAGEFDPPTVEPL
jgi:hypothetical protein